MQLGQWPPMRLGRSVSTRPWWQPSIGFGTRRLVWCLPQSNLDGIHRPAARSKRFVFPVDRVHQGKRIRRIRPPRR